METKQIYEEEMSKSENIIEVTVGGLILNEEVISDDFFSRPKKDYEDYLNSGNYLPIVVHENFVCDGNHRVIVAKEIGMEKIKAINMEECKRINDIIDERLKALETSSEIVDSSEVSE